MPGWIVARFQTTPVLPFYRFTFRPDILYAELHLGLGKLFLEPLVKAFEKSVR